MVQITITDELAQAIANAGPGVTLVDSRGRTVGRLSNIESQTETAGPLGMTAEHREEIKRRMSEDDGTRHTLAEVMERVRALAPE